jgi:hypothetical protein
MKKTLKTYRPFQPWVFEDHEQWLLAMSRSGWFYKGQDFIGLQHFEQGAAAQVEYCWDKVPRGDGEGERYRRQCRENGWEVAGSVGRWLCWSRPVAAGEVRQAPRGWQGTRDLCQKNVVHHWAMAILTALAFALMLLGVLAKLPHVWHWSDCLILLLPGMAISSARDALRAGSRVRALAQAV